MRRDRARVAELCATLGEYPPRCVVQWVGTTASLSCASVGVELKRKWDDTVTHIVCPANTLVTHKLVTGLVAQLSVVTVCGAMLFCRLFARRPLAQSFVRVSVGVVGKRREPRICV